MAGQRIFRYSFLENEKKKFLKTNKDLEIHGVNFSQPLNELICLNPKTFKIKKEGVVLNQETLKIISKKIYQHILSEKKTQEFLIRDNKVNLYVYTVSKLNDINLFLVWNINTCVAHQTRVEWEQNFKKIPNLCCRENLIYYQENILNAPTIDQLLYDRCNFNPNYINCVVAMSANLINFQETCFDLSSLSSFNLEINQNWFFGPKMNTSLFSYGSIDNPELIPCTKLYDRITLEHNFKSFLKDSLSTIFYYQNTIQSTVYPLDKIEHYLLYFSVHI